MNTKDIQHILTEMDIPESRKDDLHWLIRNLGIRNSTHPKFDEAMSVIKQKIKNN